MTRSEAYRGLSEVVDLQLAERRGSKVEILTVNPNPWLTTTVIEFYVPIEGEAHWEFYDVAGKTLLTRKENYTKGRHQLILNRSDLPSSGVIYAKLKTNIGVTEYKMLVIN